MHYRGAPPLVGPTGDDAAVGAMSCPSTPSPAGGENRDPDVARGAVGIDICKKCESTFNGFFWTPLILEEKNRIFFAIYIFYV